MVPWFYAGCSFTLFAFFCIQEFCCLDFMILVLFTTFAITHFGIMLPRFHVPYFIYSIWILELCCLDSMFLFSFYGMCILNYGIMLPRFHDSKFYLRHLHSTFWNYVASIPCSLFHLWYLNSAIPILEYLCCLDSMIIDHLRTVFGIQGIYYTVIMLPRFHRVRTRWPGNNLRVRLKAWETGTDISRIIWKSHLQNNLRSGSIFVSLCK